MTVIVQNVITININIKCIDFKKPIISLEALRTVGNITNICDIVKTHYLREIHKTQVNNKNKRVKVFHLQDDV